MHHLYVWTDSGVVAAAAAALQGAALAAQRHCKYILLVSLFPSQAPPNLWHRAGFDKQKSSSRETSSFSLASLARLAPQAAHICPGCR
jgi:hypothetical protein